MAKTAIRKRTPAKSSRRPARAAASADAAGHARLNPPAISANPNYSHGVLVAPGERLLALSAQVGRNADGTVPEGIEAQTEIVWRNIRSVLEQAGMGMEDIIHYFSFLVRREDAAAYGRVRLAALGNARPASTLIFISGLGASQPELLCEVQVTAAKAGPAPSKPAARATLARRIRKR